MVINAASILCLCPGVRFSNGDTNFRFLAQAGKLAAVENQRWRRRKGAEFHLADKNHMVALGIAATVMTFKPGRRALDDGLAGARQLVLHTFPRIDATG